MSSGEAGTTTGHAIQNSDLSRLATALKRGQDEFIVEKCCSDAADLASRHFVCARDAEAFPTKLMNSHIGFWSKQKLEGKVHSGGDAALTRSPEVVGSDACNRDSLAERSSGHQHADANQIRAEDFQCDQH